MVKVTVEEKVSRTRVVDVEFPLYIELSDALDSGDCYQYEHRILSTGAVDTIIKREAREGDITYEIQTDRVEQRQIGQYLQDSYRPSKKENFDKLLAEIQSAITKIASRSKEF